MCVCVCVFVLSFRPFRCHQSHSLDWSALRVGKSPLIERFPTCGKKDLTHISSLSGSTADGEFAVFHIIGSYYICGIMTILCEIVSYTVSTMSISLQLGVM